MEAAIDVKKIFRDRRLSRYTASSRQVSETMHAVNDISPETPLAHNEIIHLTDAERTLFVAAVAPGVEEQRQRLGNQLCSYLES